MKVTTAHTRSVWASGDFAGDDRRPTTRVTIQKTVASLPQYRLTEARTLDWAHSGTYRSLLFGPGKQRPRELFNVRTVNWSRGTDTDVGSCTIVLGNVQARTKADGLSPYEMDLPGYYTPNRGDEDYFDEWGYVSNAWKNWLIPDRLIRTYEGYGSSPELAPEDDPHLYPSGVWMIDDVEITTEGLITLTCRDLGRVLTDQILFMGLVPPQVYPLTFNKATNRGPTQHYVGPVDGLHWTIPAYDTDSNKAYAKHPELRDNGRPLVASDGTVYGHHARDAFDDSTYTYWVSTGFTSNSSRDGYVYVQGKLPNPGPVEGVRINAHHGPYRVYISLQDASGRWLGNKRIPYKAGDVDTNANIPYVGEYDVKKGQTKNIKLPKRYANIAKIRYTFGHLAWEGFGNRNVHHAAIETVYYCSNVTEIPFPGAFKFGNYSDYTDIVKWLLAWSGWFWPMRESGLTKQVKSDGEIYEYAPAERDPTLVDGRAWGDFETTGTAGVVKFDVDSWDKKPVLEGIALIREITGFDFWIDETGGAIWRLPNIWDKGCYLMPEKGGPRTQRTNSLVTIDERKHLMNMSVKLSSKNVREKIFVANSTGKFGSVVNGYHPANIGLRRYAGWTDQKFESSAECDRMADLIALKQSFTYRTNTLTITANPALQPDDQIIIKERTTGEGYLHRITNISSNFDYDTGQWTYDLTTNWLGNEAFTKKAWNPEKFRNATKVYLHYMGKLGGK